MVEKITDSIKICSYTNSMELGRLLGLNETIRMLNMIKESPKQYKDLISNVSISDPSLSRRLKMLQCLNIIEKEKIRSDGRKTHSYNLTFQGEKVMRFIEIFEKENSYNLK
jgi:DNA-binding HxlR family transcriptional regulator